MVDSGLLNPDGQGRGMKYFLSELFYCNPENNEDNSVNNEDNSVNSEGNSVNNEEGSVNNEGNSVNNEDNSPIDKETMEQLKNISREAREKKRLIVIA